MIAVMSMGILEDQTYCLKNTAYLIDFNLCGKEGTAYPFNYNRHIEERYRDARKDLP